MSDFTLHNESRKQARRDLRRLPSGTVLVKMPTNEDL